MKKIINILKKKVVPLDKFIKIVLYDKNHGYYTKKNPFGNSGDFITAPLVSNIFGEMIAIWCIAYWKHLKEPKIINIVELGPGDGTLCVSLIKTFKRFPEFYKSLKINLFEISRKLKKIQKSKIKNNKVQWLNKLENVKCGPVIFLGNEFFDSLPIKQIYIKKKLLFEKFVAFSKKNKKFKFIFKRANKKLIKEIEGFNFLSYPGNVIEYPIETLKYLKIIAKKIKILDGGLLILDYGYIKQKNNNTLQAIKKNKYSKILSNLGNSDISSHVNFGLIFNILKKNKLCVNHIVNQNEFLQKMGINERANILAEKMTFKNKAGMYYKLKKLLDYKEMGSLFKVLFAQKKNKRFLTGF